MMAAQKDATGRFAELPDTFRYTDARNLSISDRALHRLLGAGRIEQIGRGLYRRADAPEADQDLIEIATKQPAATLCLGTALSRHGLSDEIPAEIDIAIPRGQWQSAARAPVRWHSFARDTFELGREEIRLDASTTIGIFSAERSIVDAFRLRHVDGNEQAYEALRRWLRSGGQPSTLLRMGKHFPVGRAALRQALEILL